MDACCRSGHSQMIAWQSWLALLAQLTCMCSMSQTRSLSSPRTAPGPWWATLWYSHWPLMWFPGRMRATIHAASCWPMQHSVVSWFPDTEQIAAACQLTLIATSKASRRVSHVRMQCLH